MSILNNYPGSKTTSGMIQFLINHTPFHLRYFELFAGSAQLYRVKKEAKELNILSDANIKVVEALKTDLDNSISGAILNMAFKEFIGSIRFYFTRADFIYLDPPYPAAARASQVPLYKYEMLTDHEHTEFLNTCRTIDANIMISTRQNDLYDIILHDWRKMEFQTVGRTGAVTEIIYMNYPEPEYLHQYDQLGANFTDRQRVRRKLQRFKDKIERLPVHERNAIITELISHNPTAVKHFTSMRDLT